MEIINNPSTILQKLQTIFYLSYQGFIFGDQYIIIKIILLKVTIIRKINDIFKDHTYYETHDCIVT